MYRIMFNFNHNITWYCVPLCVMYDIMYNTHLAHTYMHPNKHAYMKMKFRCTSEQDDIHD